MRDLWQVDKGSNLEDYNRGLGSHVPNAPVLQRFDAAHQVQQTSHGVGN